MTRFRMLIGLLCLTVVWMLAVQASAEEADRYLIGPGDVLEISVYQDQTLAREVVVPPDGVISYPLIGEVDVSGMTVTEVRQAIAKKMGAYIPDASVSVIFRQVNSLIASVVGKVNNPGFFRINLDTTVLQLLSMAGGLNPFAKSNQLLIMRNNGGQTEAIPFDYQMVSKGQGLEQNIVLKSGDVVVVP